MAYNIISLAVFGNDTSVCQGWKWIQCLRCILRFGNVHASHFCKFTEKKNTVLWSRCLLVCTILLWFVIEVPWGKHKCMWWKIEPMEGSGAGTWCAHQCPQHMTFLKLTLTIGSSYSCFKVCCSLMQTEIVEKHPVVTLHHRCPLHLRLNVNMVHSPWGVPLRVYVVVFTNITTILTTWLTALCERKNKKEANKHIHALPNSSPRGQQWPGSPHADGAQSKHCKSTLIHICWHYTCVFALLEFRFLINSRRLFQLSDLFSTW